jgi:hypothetical protein
MCGICDGDPVRRRFVNEALHAGRSQTAIENESRRRGMPVKRETIRRHLRNCVIPAIDSAPLPLGLKARDQMSHKERALIPAGPTGRPPTPNDKFLTLPTDTKDFALLVRDAAVEKLRNGELRIGAQDGLNAQNLLDRREEKKKDRDLLGQLGRLLAGQDSPPPPIVIEGHAEQIE